MKLFKTQKWPAFFCIGLSVLFAILGVFLIVSPENEDTGAVGVVGFVLAAFLIIVGVVSLCMPTRSVTLENEKLVFTKMKFEPKNSSYASPENKTLVIPVHEVLDIQIQGNSKSKSFWAAFLGGAIGAALASNSNPDKMIIKTTKEQVIFFLPQQAANKIKSTVKINPAPVEQESGE